MSQLVVRPARAEDKPVILAFCQQTFSWGDYIAEVWERWLQSTSGQLLVATIDTQPVGVVFAELLGNRAAWMAGMRVDPDYRRHGVASALDQAARDFGRAHDCRIARLATSTKNIPAQTLLEKIGYRRVARFNEWEVDAAPNDFSRWRVAQTNDIELILVSWSNSEIQITGHSLAPDEHWRWREIDSARLRQHIDAKEIRVSERNWGMAVAHQDGDWSGLLIHAAVGDTQAIFEFAVAMRGESNHRGFKHVEAMLPDLAIVNEAMARAEYQSDSGMLIYECAL